MNQKGTQFYKNEFLKNENKLLITRVLGAVFFVKFRKLFADTEISKNIS